MKKMFVQRVLFYALTVFIVFTTAAKSYAQNNSWLKRDWEGRAYTLGNDPQNFSLTLTISSVKGKEFEGVIKAFETANPSNHFDSKISGVVNDRYLYINIATWKAKCSTCRPKVLEYSMESGRFFFKGEAKGCSTVECTWITEFSEPLEKFNFKEQDVLFSMADVEPPAPIDTTAVAKNDKPVADTTAVVKETPPPPPTPQRITVLAAGEVAVVVKNNPGANTPSSLDKNNSIMIKQNEIPEKRLPVLLSGGVVALNTNISATTKTPVTLLGTEAMSVKENVVPEKRIPVLQSGDVVSAKNNTNSSAQNPPSSLNATSSITVKQNEVPEQKFEVLPAGDIVLAAHTSAIALKKTTYPLPVKNTSLKVKVHENTPVAVQKTLPPKDTAAALPTGYAERKKNVIRTLTVNTDSIMLRVYDNGVVDGDIVSVIYNDKVVIDKLSLTSHAVEVKIPVTKTGINTLVFHAHNLGEFPPNTALLEVLYGNKKEELTVSSDLTVSSAIDIEYQQ